MLEKDNQKTEQILDSKPETSRGGRLDELVTTLSFGLLGIETTATVGFKDEVSGRIFKSHPAKFSMQENQIVYVNDLSKTAHNVSRRIVKNRKK